MKFFDNLRISHKISALMVGLIFGFIVIGVTYYVQVNIENEGRTQEQTTLQTRGQLALLNQQVSTALKQASGYWQNPNPEALTATLATLITVGEDLNSSAAQFAETNPDISAAINSVAEQLQQYQNLFTQTANTLTAIGTTSGGQLADIKSQQQNLNAVLINSNANLFGWLADFTASSALLTATDIARIDRQIAASNLDGDTKANLVNALNNFAAELNTLNTQRNNIPNQQNQLMSLSTAINDLLAVELADSLNASASARAANAEQRQLVQAIVTAIIFVVAMGTAVGVYFLYKSIVFPMVHMQSVIGKINRGKTKARVKVLTQDELGDLGKAFNQLLDERIKQLEDRSLENDQLNNSIISLIKALGMIAQKDLTVKVPVSPDVTGTISDAVNLLTSETASTLEVVKQISEQVNHISETLQQQSNQVIQFADGEKRQVMATAKALEILARAMGEVAAHAENADTSAAKAIDNTHQARQSVEETVNGIRTIRETISETEKRTKRLGDRSQEISGIVNLINTIAERTHILALNASMHAASAGEAGRGFAVVADEVQRLAESARESTDEIASMVNNMRVETSDTVAIMNTLIAQVAAGSRLAEEAGKRMADTEQATQTLVEEVKHIAKQAVQQAEVANRVRDRSGVIRKFTDKTGQQLEEQKTQTDSLKQLADSLVNQVNVFTLPVSDKKVVVLPEQDTGSTNATEKASAIKPDNVSPLHAAS